MNVGKTLFAQVMEFVPWKTFARIIERHKGDVGVRTLGCADLFRIMAFSQLTWRESLRDIEVCLEAERTRKKLRAQQALFLCRYRSKVDRVRRPRRRLRKSPRHLQQNAAASPVVRSAVVDVVALGVRIDA